MKSKGIDIRKFQGKKQVELCPYIKVARIWSCLSVGILSVLTSSPAVLTQAKFLLTSVRGFA